MEVEERCLIYDCDLIVKDGICTEDCICEDCALVDEKGIREIEERAKKLNARKLSMND